MCVGVRASSLSSDCEEHSGLFQGMHINVTRDLEVW